MKVRKIIQIIFNWWQLEMRTGRAGPRAGPGRAGLTFLGPRAESLPRKTKGQHEKTKISYKTKIKLIFYRKF